MDKIGEYIPLIIIVLSFIYSFAKKARKKEVSQTQEEKNKRRPEFTKTPSSEYEWNSLDTVPDNVFRPDSFIGATFKKDPEKKTNENLSPIFIEEITDNVGVSVDFGDVEEVKKGIIYTEIFNRKY